MNRNKIVVYSSIFQNIVCSVSLISHNAIHLCQCIFLVESDPKGNASSGMSFALTSPWHFSEGIQCLSWAFLWSHLMEWEVSTFKAGGVERIPLPLYHLLLHNQYDWLELRFLFWLCSKGRWIVRTAKVPNSQLTLLRTWWTSSRMKHLLTMGRANKYQAECFG